MYDNKNIKITYEIPDTLVVFGDKSRISQVISNLISNSIKFSSDLVSISIKAQRKVINMHNAGSKEMVILKVKDAGVGIDKEIFKKLFSKFTTDSYQGMGLGFTSQKRLLWHTVETYGQRITRMIREQHLVSVYLYDILCIVTLFH